MVVKCKVGGSLTLTNLNNFLIKGGEVVDFTKFFSTEELKRERRAPEGCLYQFIQRGFLEEIPENSPEYKTFKYEEVKRQLESRKLDIQRNMSRALVKFFRKGKVDKLMSIRSFDYAFYDFLLEVKNQEKDPDVVYEIFRTLNNFSSQRIQEGFILL